MMVHRVLVITDDSILSYGISNLLNSSQDDLVAVVSKVQTPSELAMEINKHYPDVILVGLSNPLARKEVLTNILMPNQKIPLILVQEDSNWLQVLHSENVLMASSKDLIKLIRSI